MNDLESISLASLPFVSFSDRSLLPNEPGIYFARSSNDEVLYIGKSVSIKSRWVSHPQYPLLEQLNCAWISWLLTDISTMNAIERAMIIQHHPTLNKSTTSMGRPYLGKERINISLPPDILAELTEAAVEEGRDRSDLIAELVRNYLRRRKVEKKSQP